MGDHYRGIGHHSIDDLHYYRVALPVNVENFSRRGTEMPLCRQLREFERDSFASGPVTRILECGELATETVAIKGDLHDMCSRCASEAVELFSAIRVPRAREDDVARLQGIAVYMANWADDFAQRPGISAWFAECATILDGLATDVSEGRA